MKKFNSRDSFFFLVLESQMSPHVMYGSARCEQVLELSRGRVLHVRAHHNTQCLSLGSLVFTHLGSIRKRNM